MQPPSVVVVEGATVVVVDGATEVVVTLGLVVVVVVSGVANAAAGTARAANTARVRMLRSFISSTVRTVGELSTDLGGGAPGQLLSISGAPPL